LHTSSQVVPAAQVFLSPPLHVNEQAVVPPQTTVHFAEPLHAAVHPPFGHATLQFELPVQVTVEPAPIEMVASAPPATLTLLSGPVSSEHVLVPPHVDTQSEAQVPVQVDWPAHDVVHPVPHVTLQLLCVSQLYVTPFAKGGAPSTAASPPKTQVPPAAHPQTPPSHTQLPVHVAWPEPASVMTEGGAPVSGGGGGAVEVAVAVTAGEASGPESAASLIVSPLLPQPTATATPTSVTEPRIMAKRRLFIVLPPNPIVAERQRSRQWHSRLSRALVR
jgi:hypothetical protein